MKIYFHRNIAPRTGITVFLVLGVLLSCFGQVWAQDSPEAMAEQRTADLLRKATQTGAVRVIVTFRTEGTQERVSKPTLAATQDAVLNKLAQFNQIDAFSVKKFDYVPGMALKVDAAGLQALLQDENVIGLSEDVPVPPALYQSIPLIDADNAWASGYAGAGQVVAILDTGVNKSHPFLSGKVVSEACYSTNATFGAGGVYTATSLCPGGATSSTASGSGLDCWGGSIAGCGHGTHVAGIAAGKNGASSGGTMHGVARDASIIAVKVFSRFNAAYCQSIGYSNSDCVLTYTSDQIKGLERVYELRNSYRIAAANMSLGGGQFTSTCDTDPTKPIIDNLRNAGIATVISSGNDGFTNATGAPGCISTAITVGSTTKSDTLSGFSNSASWVDLLAPGGGICSSVNGWTQNCGTGYGFASGTSMAAPHVTGAWAVLKSKNGIATVTSVENALESTGVSISTPPGNKPRIDLDGALSALGGGINVGLNWDRCQQAYRALGDNKTWCFLLSNQLWISVNDEEAEETLIEAAASGHWLGFNVASISGTSFVINHVRLWNN